MPTKFSLEMLWEQLAFGIIAVDETNVVRRVNGAAERIFGKARQHLLGVSLERLLPGHPVALDHCAVRILHRHNRCFCQGLQIPRGREVIHPHGRSMWPEPDRVYQLELAVADVDLLAIDTKAKRLAFARDLDLKRFSRRDERVGIAELRGLTEH